MVVFVSDQRLLRGAVRRRTSAKVKLIDAAAKTHDLPHDAVLHTLRATLSPPNTDPRTIARHLRALPTHTDPLDPQLLLATMEPDTRYTLAALCDLYFGDRSDPHLLTLLDALAPPPDHTLHPHLRRYGASLAQRPPAEIERLRANEARKQAKQARLDALAAWLGGGPRPDLDLDPELSQLTDYALAGDRSAHAKRVRRLLPDLGLDSPDHALAALEGAGALPRHTNELPRRHGLSVNFPEALLEHTAPPLPDDLLDLTAHPTLAIDDVDTFEVDDAFSVWEDAEGRHLAVHVALCVHALPLDSPLDLEARRRSTSIYTLPDPIPMLPPALTHSLSLSPGTPRAALSLICDLDDQHLPARTRFALTRITVDEAPDYQTPPDSPHLQQVIDLAQRTARALRARRLARGATPLEVPQVKFRFDDPDDPQLHRVPAETPTLQLVAELMVLYNAALADWFAETRTTALFRTQAPPDSLPKLPQPLPSPFLVFQGRPPAQTKTRPAPHHGLGVDAYVQASSPLRRYTDVCAQRQAVALLRDQPPPLSRTALERLQTQLREAERRARQLEDARDRYWIRLWLHRQRPTLHGRVARLDRTPDASTPRLKVYVPLLARELTVLGTPSLRLGDSVDLDVEHAAPRDTQLTLRARPADSPAEDE